jgi:hypothetical protein
MAKVFAIFSSLLFMITLSACSAQGQQSGTYSALPAGGANSAALSQSRTRASVSASSVSASPRTTPSAPKKSAPALPLASSGISITPDEDSRRIHVVYPGSDINANGEPAGETVTLPWTPGNYSDPENAVTTFMFDLLMKQSLCFDNIHANIKTDNENTSFMRSLDLLEQLISNLGQVDVLILPKIAYYSDGTPYMYKKTIAGYKSHENGVIRFGSIVQEEGYKQVTRGRFLCDDVSLYYEVTTQVKDEAPSVFYFEAQKAKNGDFTYRSINIFRDQMKSVYASVANEWLEAGFSEGKLPENFKFSPLQKSTTMQKSEAENHLKQVYTLFASGDGALIKPADEDGE